MKSVERRIADRKVLWLIRRWLKVPVHETNQRGRTVVLGGKQTKYGTPQGGVISPLLANIYFRRFLVAWERMGLNEKYRAQIVNYADDFVILTRGQAREALNAARQILSQIGLTLNETKTRTCRAWNTSFDFLGYTFGLRYTHQGKPYLNLTPSRKKAQQYRATIRQLTGADQWWKEAESVKRAVNQVTRGFWNYFSLGDTAKLRRALDEYLWERVFRWARKKHKRPQKSRHPKQAKAEWRRRIREATQGLVRGRDLVPAACQAK